MMTALESASTKKEVVEAWEKLAISLGWDGWDVRLRLDEVGKPKQFE